MKIIYLILLLFIIDGFDNKKLTSIPTNIEGKEEFICNISPNIRTSSASNFYLEEISKKTYDSIHFKTNNQFELITNSDSLEQSYKKLHPKIFNKKDGKYTFKPENSDRSFIVWNNLVQDKTYSKYEFKAIFKNYIIIWQEMYEQWNSLIIDINSGKSYIGISEPYFINGNLFFSYSEYYGDMDVFIIDIQKEEYIYLAYNNVTPLSHKLNYNGISLELKCSNSQTKIYNNK